MYRSVISIMCAIAACWMHGCASSACCKTSRQAVANAHAAHAAYEAAINAQSTEAFLSMLTDDVVFMPPHGPRMVGKDTLREWADGYIDGYTFNWDKEQLDIIVAGKLAIEQYTYRSMETPKAGGDVIRDTGKGIIIYRLEPDGVWRVCQDAWNSDLP